MSQQPTDQVRQLYEAAEAAAAKATESLVNTGAFAELLGLMASNAVALTKLWSDALDLLYRNLRLAGRSDLTRLGRQLVRTEDKLELLLQEVERLADAVDGERRP